MVTELDCTRCGACCTDQLIPISKGDRVPPDIVSFKVEVAPK